MNSQQRIVLIIGVLLVLSMALFPPWRCVMDNSEVGRAERSVGYRFLFADNAPTDPIAINALFGMQKTTYVIRNEERTTNIFPLHFFTIQIDILRLLVQVAMTLIVIAMLCIAFRSTKQLVNV